MYLPKNYQYTSHVAGERYSMWNWSDRASLVDINYRCLTNTHWSGQRHLRMCTHTLPITYRDPNVYFTDCSHRVLCQGFSTSAILGESIHCRMYRKNSTPWLKEHLQCVWRLWKPSGHFLLIFFLIVCLCLEKMLDLKFSHLWWLII